MSMGHDVRLIRMARTSQHLATAVAFYRDTLDFTVCDERSIEDRSWAALMEIPGGRGQSVLMRLGAQELELVRFDPPGRPYPPGSSATDLWFQHLAIVVSDMDAACRRLGARSGIAISHGGPQTLPPNTGSVTAFKFRDPDGHPLELIQFPPGTGAPEWQDETALFLGIDHSAISVADTPESVRFYSEGLAWQVTSHSVNAGPSQDRLDGVEGDIVDVTALQPAVPGPPHLELLGYKHPRGRPLPVPAHPNDVSADRLVLAVHHLAPLLQRLAVLRGTGSPEPVETPGAALVRDPSGHLLLLCGARSSTPATDSGRAIGLQGSDATAGQALPGQVPPQVR